MRRWGIVHAAGADNKWGEGQVKSCVRSKRKRFGRMPDEYRQCSNRGDADYAININGNGIVNYNAVVCITAGTGSCFSDTGACG